ncbi:hypothetical protein JR316_0001806 [Psilocybe cubensis]|nr:hypothetical protein JR316_0001806 [Psilocybe cubensis]KAH9484904.1 hypothetical protein JR316_0001806 [Psilocybe cubensis]
MLSRRPDIARHVRRLVVRPHASKPHMTILENIEVATAVRNIASGMCLDALVRFHWDADELPMLDDMWFALRMGCPQLRFLGISVGATIPQPKSHLYDFKDLLGFSLTLKHGFFDNQIDMFVDEEHAVLRKFWDMLIHRCPNLEELGIDGYSSVPADVHLILEGRWPSLRKLTLGDVCVDWFNRSISPGEKRPFITFLEAHPSLKSLSLSRHTIQAIHFNTLEPGSLPNVTRFSGTHQQLQALPHLHRMIEYVTFRDPVETRDVSAPTVASLLRDLPSLMSLKIAFTLHSMYDSGNLLRSLIQSCPMLRHLELTCAHKPSFQLDTFAKTIRGFPKLRSLHLTIVKYPGDETLVSGATRIAQSNPRLQTFSLTFIPPVYPVPLPFSFALPNRTLIPFALPVRATGVFEVACDVHGLPLTLTGTEYCRFVWPLGLGVSTRTRKYSTDLRPMGYPGRHRKTGVLGVLSLLVEGSSAGEEIRVLVFCAFLTVLAAFGIAVNGSSGGSRSRTLAQAGASVAAAANGVQE